MSEFIDSASKYRSDAHRRDVAHELSAAWHGKWGARLGFASTTLSAIIGTTVFYTFLARFHLDAKGTLDIPQDWWGRALFYAIVVISLAAPVLSAWQSYELGEQVKHTSSKAQYFRLARRLDSVILRYEGVSVAGKEQEEALNELDRISEETSAVRKDEPRITLQAYNDADIQIAGEGPR